MQSSVVVGAGGFCVISLILRIHEFFILLSSPYKSDRIER
jgi:hypothetical protein